VVSGLSQNVRLLRASLRAPHLPLDAGAFQDRRDERVELAVLGRCRVSGIEFFGQRVDCDLVDGGQRSCALGIGDIGRPTDGPARQSSREFLFQERERGSEHGGTLLILVSYIRENRLN
jgi:hypothetical protein